MKYNLKAPKNVPNTLHGKGNFTIGDLIEVMSNFDKKANVRFAFMTNGNIAINQKEDFIFFVHGEDDYELLIITKTDKRTKLKAATKERIKKELTRRLDLWLTHTTLDEMTVGFSKLRFEMALGAGGYPFEPQEWMTSKETKRIITDEQFNCPDYDDIISDLFIEAYEKYAEK